MLVCGDVSARIPSIIIYRIQIAFSLFVLIINVRTPAVSIHREPTHRRQTVLEPKQIIIDRGGNPGEMFQTVTNVGE